MNPSLARPFTAVAAVCAAGAVFADQPDWTQYQQSFDVKFRGYAGSTTLTNFPALIRLSAARNAFDYSKCKLADGADTRFFDADGNLLPSEVDTWNPDGESLVWVSVPELNRDTTITVRYGNANAPAVTSTDVWTNGYVAVWHMSAAEGTFTQKDSTTTGKNLNGANNSAYREGMLCGVEGAVGRAAELGRDGVTSGGFGVSDTEGALDGFSALTLEAWTYQTAYPTDNHRYLFTKKGTSNNAYYFEQLKGTSGKFAAYVRRSLNGGNPTEPGVWQTADPGAALNEWTHQVYRWRGNTGRADGFLNGSNVVTDAAADYKKGTIVQVGGSLYIGNLNLSNNRVFPGKMDEVRISNVARSDDWIVATHDTVASDGFAVSEVPNDWTKYAHKFSVAFPGVAEGATLENFPVLVKVSEAGISGFHYTDCAKPDGGDLRFSDANGTLLPCEVEDWNTEGESLIWVKVPSLTKGTRITCYYGWYLAPAVDSTEVWDANYLAVWHMDAAARNLNQKDATANGKHIAPNSSNTAGILCGVEGVVGAAAELGRDGVKTGAFCVDDGTGFFDGSANGFTAITVEAWSFQTNYTSYKAILVAKRKTNPAKVSYILEEAENTGKIVGISYVGSGDGTYCDAWQSSGSGVPCGEWAHSVFRWDGQEGSNTAFLNGSIVKKNTGDNRKGTLSRAGSGSSLFVGNNTADQWGNQVFPGKIDEVRISNAARSDAWVKATHDTIANNATFTRYGRAGDNISGTVVIFR